MTEHSAHTSDNGCECGALMVNLPSIVGVADLALEFGA